jgi:hypothetical protein
MPAPRRTAPLRQQRNSSGAVATLAVRRHGNVSTPDPRRAGVAASRRPLAHVRAAAADSPVKSAGAANGEKVGV